MAEESVKVVPIDLSILLIPLQTFQTLLKFFDAMINEQ